MDQNQTPIIVSATDFRRNAGSYFDREVPLIIVRDSQVIGDYIPRKRGNGLSIAEKIKIVEDNAGVLKIKTSKTADEMNEDYDKMYETMLH